MKKIRLAEITKDFLKLVKNKTLSVVYSTPGVNTSKGAGWITVIQDHNNELNTDYYFCQRLGKNSLAFLLYDNNTKKYGVLTQYSSQENSFKTGCFTGSLEKDDLNIMEHLIAEIKEEAGYVVDEDRCKQIGIFPLGGITNEESLLYIVDVSGIHQRLKEPENVFEANTKITFLTKEQVLELNDWKAILAVTL